MKILVPAHYYDTGYAGVVSGLTLSMAGELDGYEAFKAFTTDDKEYLKYTAPIYMSNPYTQNLTQGLVIISDSWMEDDTERVYLENSSTLGGTYTAKNISAVYGDGTNGGTYIYPENAITGVTKCFAIYSSTDTAYRYYRVRLTAAESQRFQIITHGYVYDVPDGYRLMPLDTSYTYRNSVVRANLVGIIYLDGLENNKIKRQHTLQLDYMNSTQKTMLLDIFKLGKGGLPMWFIDDENDKNTWIFAKMVSMTVVEDYVEYYKITINMEEY